MDFHYCSLYCQWLRSSSVKSENITRIKFLSLHFLQKAAFQTKTWGCSKSDQPCRLKMLQDLWALFFKSLATWALLSRCYAEKFMYCTVKRENNTIRSTLDQLQHIPWSLDNLCIRYLHHLRLNPSYIHSQVGSYRLCNNSNLAGSLHVTLRETSLIKSW